MKSSLRLSFRWLNVLSLFLSAFVFNSAVQFSDAHASEPIQAVALLSSSGSVINLKGWKTRYSDEITNFDLSLVNSNREIVEKNLVMNSSGIKGIRSGVGNNYEILLSIESDLQSIGGARGFVQILEEVLQQRLQVRLPTQPVSVAIALFDQNGKLQLIDFATELKKSKR